MEGREEAHTHTHTHTTPTSGTPDTNTVQINAPLLQWSGYIEPGHLGRGVMGRPEESGAEFFIFFPNVPINLHIKRVGKVGENTGDHRRNVESETRNLVRRHMRDIDRAIDDRRARRAREARDDEPAIWGPGTGDHAGGTITARHGRET